MIPNNDGGSRNTKSPLWMQDGRTLSKNLLYTPLVAYYQKSAIGTSDHDSSSSSPSKSAHPSQYMNNKKAVPASLRESSLASTLHFISCDYHRNVATINDAKNNGSRPLGLSDVDDRIRQRAVTLVGGGINSSIPLAKTAKRSKKRRHRSWEEAGPILRKSSVEEMILELESSQTILFLRKLNSAWNKYAWKLFTNEKDENENRRMSDDDLKKIEVRLGALVRKKNLGSTRGRSKNGGSFNEGDSSKDDHIDLVGAHLKINSSNSHTSWVGRFGVLIGETKNTYRIASNARNRKKTKIANKKRQESKLEKPRGLGVEKDLGDFVQGTTHQTPSDPSINGCRATDVEMLVLPKRGSVLQLILPLSSGKSKELDCDTNKETIPDSEGVSLETMIAVPDEAIGICIAD